MIKVGKKLGVKGGKVVAYTQPHPSTNRYGVRVSRHQETAATGATTKLSMAASANTNVAEGYMTGLVTDNERELVNAYRDMYYNDSICGSAVDLWSELPFSDFQVYGLPEDKLEVYNSALARLNLRSACSQITRQYLVEGSYTATLVFDQKNTQFIDQIPYAYEDLTFEESPLLSQDPVITAKVSRRFDEFLNNTSPEWNNLRKVVPSQLLNALKSGEFVLDPLSTLHLARRTFPSDKPVSYLKRCLPIYMLEKVLYRGTLFELSRRQRANVLVTAGDDIWEPTPEELTAIANLFQQSDLDPMGALIVTRNGINIQEFRCLAGDTLVSHETKGLVTIDSLVEHNPETMKRDTTFMLDNVSIKGIDGNYQEVSEWHFRGKTDVVRVKTKRGREIVVTKEHKFPTMVDGQLKLVEAQNLLGKYVLVERGGEQPERIRLPISYDITHKSYKRIKLPKVMTPELAYLIGLVVSEGYISKNNVVFTNTDDDIVNKGIECFKRVFNAKVKTRSAELESGKQIRECSVHSRLISSIFKQLGVTEAKEVRELGGKPCNHYGIPHSIMEGAKETKLAFLAAYLDGDGTIGNKQGRESIAAKFFTSSNLIARQLMVLLADLGIVARNDIQVCNPHEINGYISERGGYQICISDGNAHLLYAMLEPYIGATRKTFDFRVEASSMNRNGIPPELFVPFIKSRIAYRKKHGTVFYNDEGKEVYVEGGWVMPLFAQVYNNVCLGYDNYKYGEYKEALRIIKMISKKLHRSLVRLFELRLVFEEVVSVEDAGQTFVYDLTMDENYGSPLFVANGIVTKNSGGDFVKWTDLYDQTTSMKLKSLGISDAFLSSDSTYNNAEQAVAVFMDNLAAYRSLFTHAVFTNKLFPLIAMAKGFFKEKVETANGLSIKKVNDYSQLDIPKVRWNKRLSASSDENMMASLEALSQKGVPIPLRLWIAASGMDPANLLADLEDDQEFRDELSKIAPSQGEDELEGLELSSISPLSTKSDGLRKLVKSGELSDAVRIGGDGKIHHIPNQAKAHREVNEKIMRAVQKLERDPNLLKQVLESTKR